MIVIYNKNYTFYLEQLFYHILILIIIFLSKNVLTKKDQMNLNEI